MHGSCSLCALLLFFHYEEPQTILQSPPFLSVPPGTAVEMSCSVEGTSSLLMYWYGKAPKQPFEVMFLSRGTGMLDDSPETHFRAERPGAQHFILRADSVRQNDTAQYYCAWSITVSDRMLRAAQKPLLELKGEWSLHSTADRICAMKADLSE
ncbi:hypothetical protein NDU88_000374 [Pleurodeles waltl]|uniref:Ig-like domain-containing protein n=1 Tax=Pleurodeles waltl TaxID=8319 RepID=A0AAV7P2M8_PLEWA|nr:hypothetical protein NDU88_000374 [Pleurodeles waltl]